MSTRLSKNKRHAMAGTESNKPTPNATNDVPTIQHDDDLAGDDTEARPGEDTSGNDDIVDSNNNGKRPELQAKLKQKIDEKQNERQTSFSKLPVYKKKQLRSPVSITPNKPSTREETRGVVSESTKCGTVLSWIQYQNGKPAFNKPLHDHVKNNPGQAYNDWKIDFVGVMRDPNDPEKIQQFYGKRKANGEQTRSLMNVFGRFPENEKEKSIDFNDKLRKLLVKCYNAPVSQREMLGNNTLAYDAGDVTPQEHKNRRYLSDVFTIKHTIDHLEKAYEGVKTRQQIVDEEETLLYYFPPDMINGVRECENRRSSWNNADESSFFDTKLE